MKYWIGAGIGCISIFVGWSYYTRDSLPTTPPVITDIATSTAPVAASSTSSRAPIKQVSIPFEINTADTITTWSFTGAYTGNDALTAKANAEVARLISLMGTGEFSDYLLYVSIANQYDLLGDGNNEFVYLKKALALDSTRTGLAWYNLGQLLTRLGAYASARTAFEHAVAAQPVAQYQQALSDFLKAHYPNQ